MYISYFLIRFRVNGFKLYLVYVKFLVLLATSTRKSKILVVLQIKRRYESCHIYLVLTETKWNFHWYDGSFFSSDWLIDGLFTRKDYLDNFTYSVAMTNFFREGENLSLPQIEKIVRFISTCGNPILPVTYCFLKWEIRRS